MHYIIEVMDALDKDSAEPWSFFGAYHDDRHLDNELQYLFSIYIKEHEIIEIRIKVERNGK